MSVGTDISQAIRKGKTSVYGQVQYTDLSPYYALVPQKYSWDRAPNSFNSTFHIKQKFGNNGNIQAYANYDRLGMIANQTTPGNIYEQSKFEIVSQNLYSNIAFRNSLGETMSYQGGGSFSKKSDQVIIEELQIETNTKAIHSKFEFIAKSYSVKASPAALALQDAILMLKQKSYKERFIVKVGEHIKSIAIKEIYHFASQEKVTFIQTKDNRKYILDYSLDQLMEMIDPSDLIQNKQKIYYINP